MSVGARIVEGLTHALDRAALLLGYTDDRSETRITGDRGEDIAYFHLRHHRYTVVARNYRSSSGGTRSELDLIAWDGETLCFIEVKTRTARDFAPADSAVDPEKREDLRRIAREYLRHLPGVSTRLRSRKKVELPQTRFDVVSVYLLPNQKPQIELQKDAFGWR
jgi:putative endonuclease